MLAACTPQADTARVFAAASIADACGQVQPGRVVVQPAASSTLAQQLLAGARADVFVSAHAEWLDALAREALLVEGSRRVLAENALVLIRTRGAETVPLPAVLGPGAALGAAFEGRIALGDPRHVPAGRYAREALEAIGAWQEIEDRIAAAADVRRALALVERGACDVGIVYRTDARASTAVEVVAELPAASRVAYEIALLRGHGDAGRAWYDAVCGAAGRAVLERAGFVVPERRE